MFVCLIVKVILFVLIFLIFNVEMERKVNWLESYVENK